jgi:hypothetical protein
MSQFGALGESLLQESAIDGRRSRTCLLAIKGGEQFHDLDELTIFADNLVPHVLRVDGVLAYDGNLAKQIEREELIRPGSDAEVEIRACAVHTVELLVKEIQTAGRDATSASLDFLLFNRGQSLSYKAASPRHRTRTVFY